MGETDWSLGSSSVFNCDFISGGTMSGNEVGKNRVTKHTLLDETLSVARARGRSPPPR